MIIAIDGYEANEANRVGIGEYAYQTLNHLHKLILKGKNVSARIYLPALPRSDMPDESEQWKYKIRKPKKLWTFGSLPLSILRDFPQANVIYSPTHYIPRFISTPKVMAIMDLSFLSYPDLFKKKDFYQLKNWTEYSVRHSRAIFTISEFSRNAIINEYQYPAEKVFVTYPGMTGTKSMTQTVDIRKKYILNNPYLLSVGTIQPRKNYEKLIEAFSKLKQKKEFQEMDLVIVGKKGWLYESILAAPNKLGVSDNVHFLDFVPDTDLPSLYAEAECFVLASLYEGFGLPVLEAMANSCQTVISDVSSLPEIAGNAGIYVKPESVDSILGGIEKSLKEKNTTIGLKRIEEGKQRVKLFSWEKAAVQTLEVLEKVGKGEL